MALSLHVGTARYFKRIVLALFAINSTRPFSQKTHTYVYDAHYLFITVKILFKKDDEMSTEIQPYAADCSGRKHRLTKRSFIMSDQFWLRVEKKRSFHALLLQKRNVNPSS